MSLGFWGGLAAPLYPSLQELPKNSRVFFNRTNYDSYRMYRREGTVPRTVHYANDPPGATVGIHFEQPEHGEREGELWSTFGTRPVAGVYADNVTLIQMYWKDRSDRAPSRAPNP